MKKAFIQKLSIAMASALVITAAAPATADAAAAMKMNKSSKVLYLNEDNMTNTKDTYDFSIKNKPSNYKTKYSFSWYAENDKIVKVAKGGVVTAKKVGQTTVKCDIIKKSTGKVYKTVSATVTVKANADTVTINNAPENGEITVGATFDFNRTMKAANGGKATDKTEWVLSADKDGKDTEGAKAIATVDKNGVVTALTAGTFYITAKTYQSESAKELGYTATSEAVEVKVVNTITELKATKTNQVQVTFGSAVDYKANDYVLTNVATGARTYVKGVTSADKKVVTLDLFNTLTSGQTYKLTVDGMENTLDFVKGEVAQIVIEDQTVEAGEASDIKYTVYDANGLDVTEGTSVYFNSSVTLSNNKITLANGVAAYVSVSYYNYTKNETITSRTATIKGAYKAATAILATTIDDSTKASTAVAYTSPVSTISKNKTGKRLFVQVKNQLGLTETATTTGVKATFESLSPEIIYVDKTTGDLTPIAEGVGIIKITSGSITTTVAITVTAEAKATSYTVAATNGSRTGTAAVAGMNYPTVTVKVLDQFANDYKVGEYTLKLVDGAGILQDFPNVGSEKTYTVDNSADALTLATGTKTGDVVLLVTYGNLGSRYVSFSVSAADNTIASSGLSNKAATIDVQKAWDNDSAGQVSYELYNKNAAGFYVSKADEIANHNGVVIEVKKADGTFVASGSSLTVNAKFLSTGTYNVTATMGNVTVDTTTLTVKDSGTAPSVVLNKNTLSGTTTISGTALANVLSIPGGYEVVEFKYGTSNSAVVSGLSNYVSTSQSVTFGDESSVVLYNLSVKVRNTTTQRVYEISNLGHLTLKN